MKQTKPTIILSLILLLFVVSCSRTDIDTVQKDINVLEAKSWFSNSKLKLAKENMNLQLQDGNTLKGKLNWDKAFNYSWKGKEYLEVPYFFNDDSRIIDNEDTVNYSVVLRTVGNSYEGAISVSQRTKSKILGTDSTTSISTRSYTLLDGKESSTWLNNNKSTRPQIVLRQKRSTAEIQQLDAQLRTVKTEGKTQTVKRKAMSADKECTTYVVKYSYPVDCGGTAADNPQILPEVCIATGKFTITECNVNIPSPDFPPSGGGGGGNDDNDSDNPLLVLSKEDQLKYPRFTKLVQGLRQYVETNKNVLDALMYQTQLTKNEILDKLQFGKGPTIIIKDIKGAYGRFNEYDNPNILNIDASFVRGLENVILESTKQGTSFLLAVTILHEFVHYGRFFKGIDGDKYEYGIGFEHDAFGVTITKYNANKYSLIFYKRSAE